MFMVNLTSGGYKKIRIQREKGGKRTRGVLYRIEKGNDIKKTRGKCECSKLVVNNARLVRDLEMLAQNIDGQDYAAPC